MGAPLRYLALCLLPACTSVGYLWQEPTYQARPVAPATLTASPPAAAPAAARATAAAAGEPLKRLTVVAWEGPSCPGLGEVLAAVVADRVKLRKNYLIGAPQRATQHWAEGCRGGTPGVLFVRPLTCVPGPLRVRLRLALELYRCADGALLWRGEAQDSARTNEVSLTDLTAHYSGLLGPRAALYSAPVFVAAQDLIDALPDPELNDAEVLEKIDAG